MQCQISKHKIPPMASKMEAPVALCRCGSQEERCAQQQQLGRAVTSKQDALTLLTQAAQCFGLSFDIILMLIMFRSFPVGYTQNSRFIPFPGYFSPSKKEFLLFSLEGSIEGLSQISYQVLINYCLRNAWIPRCQVNSESNTLLHGLLYGSLVKMITKVMQEISYSVIQKQ